jgi:hypothetical protein
MRLSKSDRTGKRKIPDPHAPDALTVTDGQERAGSVVRQDDEFFAFDAEGKCLGAFDTAIEAVRRIPALCSSSSTSA